LFEDGTKITLSNKVIVICGVVVVSAAAAAAKYKY